MAKNVLILLFMGLLLGCGSGINSDAPIAPPVNPPVEQIKIPIVISTAAWSKVTDDAYELGDQIGLYVVNYSNGAPGSLASSGNHVNNVCHTLADGSVWNPASGIYWLDDVTKADFYCYFPYRSISNVGQVSFGVVADQSTVANYKLSEFMWGASKGVSASGNSVPITTYHSMSCVVVNLVKGQGHTDASFAALSKSVSLSGVDRLSNIDLRSGVATAAGDNGNIEMGLVGDSFKALIVPQSIAVGANLFIVTIDGVEKSVSVDQAIIFGGNKRKSFDLIINKGGSGIDVGVGGWEDDGVDQGGSAQ